MREVAYLSLIFTQFLGIKHYSNERLCHHLLNFFGPLKLFQTPSSPRSISPWVELLWESWWGKKWYCFFCTNTMKISLIMTWNPKILYQGIALGWCDHFITSEVQNLSKIGVASHEVGVAKASSSWWGSRPTNWIGSSTCAFPCSACNCNGLIQPFTITYLVQIVKRLISK